MKITDVSLTLFAWDDIPATRYGLHSSFAGSSALGLLRIRTAPHPGVGLRQTGQPLDGRWLQSETATISIDR